MTADPQQRTTKVGLERRALLVTTWLGFLELGLCGGEQANLKH